MEDHHQPVVPRNMYGANTVLRESTIPAHHQSPYFRQPQSQPQPPPPPPPPSRYGGPSQYGAPPDGSGMYGNFDGGGEYAYPDPPPDNPSQLTSLFTGNAIIIGLLVVAAIVVSISLYYLLGGRGSEKSDQENATDGTKKGGGRDDSGGESDEDGDEADRDSEEDTKTKSSKHKKDNGKSSSGDGSSSGKKRYSIESSTSKIQDDNLRRMMEVYRNDGDRARQEQEQREREKAAKKVTFETDKRITEEQMARKREHDMAVQAQHDAQIDAEYRREEAYKKMQQMQQAQQAQYAQQAHSQPPQYGIPAYYNNTGSGGSRNDTGHQQQQPTQALNFLSKPPSRQTPPMITENENGDDELVNENSNNETSATNTYAENPSRSKNRKPKPKQRRDKNGE